MPGVPPAQVLAHRIVWCLLFLSVVLGARRQWAWLGRVARQPRVLLAFGASALLIAGNWMTYIWAVGNGRIVDASLGYFITPLVNVLLGFTVLGERPRRVQWTALALAAIGVAWLTWQAGRLPWIALVLALTFGGYGLMRKIAALGPLEGLMLETILLGPLALLGLAYWWHTGTGWFPAADAGTDLWLVALGPITAIPLLLFAAGARRLSLTTLGLLQYIGPTIQLGVAVGLLGEPFSTERLTGFACIWAALAVYTLDGWRTSRRITAVPA